ncbi:hypothetical protein EZV62_002543 [Acer yangbiense]|uniref:Myb/SANT-like domain-containing protein n=1 Tax=Acer yangbiense TaxID=1000413 RepID=A0A5C7IYK4_9ROSI|nr:hypothetical protein EZV62_002543 [Acer yangbiense]
MITLLLVPNPNCRRSNITDQKPDPIPNDCTDARWKWFKGCLEALDGTHIKVRVSEKDKPRYRTRKGEVATNVLDGARCDTGSFKAGTSTQTEKTLNSILPNSGIKASPHIDYKIRFWKKQYGIVFDMLNTSGFGWNDTKKCVEVDSNEVWEMYVLKDKSFPLYDRLVNIFGKDRATGQVTGTPQQILDEVNLEGTNMDGMGNMEGVGSPMLVPQQASDSIHLVNGELSRPRKRARRDTLTLVGFKEVENVIQNVFKQSYNEMKELAATVFGHNEDKSDIADELATMGLELDDELDALTLILDKPSNISAFKSLKGARGHAFVEKLL